MATPFTVTGNLLLPIDAGQPNSTVVFTQDGAFDAKVDLELNYSGAATETIPLGTAGAVGLKVLVVEVDDVITTAPVYLLFNGGDTAGKLEVSPGGFAVFCNPAPVAGILTLQLNHTTAAKIRLRGLA